jgi:hypothetical protein
VRKVRIIGRDEKRIPAFRQSVTGKKHHRRCAFGQVGGEIAHQRQHLVPSRIEVRAIAVERIAELRQAGCDSLRITGRVAQIACALKPFHTDDQGMMFTLLRERDARERYQQQR